MEIELHQLDMRYEVLRVADPGEESRLAVSLASTGQHSPVLVVPAEEPDRYRLIDGFRRVRALRSLARDTVEALVGKLAQRGELGEQLEVPVGEWTVTEPQALQALQ